MERILCFRTADQTCYLDLNGEKDRQFAKAQKSPFFVVSPSHLISTIKINLSMKQTDGESTFDVFGKKIFCIEKNGHCLAVISAVRAIKESESSDKGRMHIDKMDLRAHLKKATEELRWFGRIVWTNVEQQLEQRVSESRQFSGTDRLKWHTDYSQNTDYSTVDDEILSIGVGF